MTYPIRVKRRGKPDLNLELGSRSVGGGINDGSLDVGGELSGPNLPFHIKGRLFADGSFRLAEVKWHPWHFDLPDDYYHPKRYPEPEKYRSLEHIGIYTGDWSNVSKSWKFPVATEEQKATVMKWHKDPSSRPFPWVVY